MSTRPAMRRRAVAAARDYLADPTPGRRAVFLTVARSYRDMAPTDDRLLLGAMEQAATAAEHELCSLLPADDGTLP